MPISADKDEDKSALPARYSKGIKQYERKIPE